MCLVKCTLSVVNFVECVVWWVVFVVRVGLLCLVCACECGMCGVKCILMGVVFL